MAGDGCADCRVGRAGAAGCCTDLLRHRQLDLCLLLCLGGLQLAPHGPAQRKSAYQSKQGPQKPAFTARIRPHQAQHGTPENAPGDHDRPPFLVPAAIWMRCRRLGRMIVPGSFRWLICVRCVGPLAGGCPAATHFSLLRQRKVSKSKGDPTAWVPALRFGRPALAGKSGGPRKLACGSDSARP